MAITNDQSSNSNPQANVNNSAPANNGEEALDFDINLGEFTTENKSNEIDINKGLEKVIEEKVIEKNQLEDLDLDLPESYINENKEEKTTESTIEKTWDENTNITDNSRLQVQDQKNKEEENGLFAVASAEINPVGIDINAEVSPNINSQVDIPVKIEPTINIDTNQTKANEFYIEKTNYNSDMKMIDELNIAKAVEEKNNFEQTPIAPQAVVIEQKNIDLDSLIAANNESTAANEAIHSVTPDASNNDLYKAILEQWKDNVKTEELNTEVKNHIDINSPETIVTWVALGGGENKTKTNHMWKFLLPAGGIAVLAVLIYFVWATMYPMESQNVIEEPIPQVTENTGIQTGLIQELTWDTTNIDTWSMSWENIVSDGSAIGETWHWVGPEFDSSWALTPDIASQDQTEEQSTIEKIKSLAVEANAFLAEGTSTNNKVYIKYSGTIAKKCGELISMLENGQEIDNLSGNLAQLEGYLQKLREIKNANNSQQSSGLLQETSSQSWTETTNTAPAIAE